MKKHMSTKLCMFSATKITVTCNTSELLIFFKNPFCLVFLPQKGSTREKFLALASPSVREIQESPVTSDIKDESEPT